ncbi:hypothetical protein C8Q80DRAFT_1274873 [Daedaleopsis nitida]|nr:hypothetical protein C8Q80DRAFT_1274873 [Daedaleopsis nitida]
MITPTSANLVSIIIETTLFGLFSLLAPTSLFLLVRRRRAMLLGVSSHSSRSSANWLTIAKDMAKSPLIVGNILMMFTVTAHWVLGLHRLFIAVVYRGGGQAANEFYTDLQDRTELARITILFLDILIGDVVMTYRTWIVWQRNHWIVVFPISTIAAFTVTSVGLLYEFGTAAPSKSVFTPVIKGWILGFSFSTLITNVYCTTTIVYRIWASNRILKTNRVLTGRGRDLTSALAILIESAAIFTAWGIMFVVFFTTHSPLQTLGSGCGPVVIGIAFMLITVRVGMGWGQNSQSVVSEGVRSPAAGTTRNQARIGQDSFPMNTFTLNVSQTVEQETDYSLSHGEVKAPRSDSDTAIPIRPVDKSIRW